MGSSWFVTVCASLRRLLPVCDSLRQFVTSGASQTVWDCHIANPVINGSKLISSPFPNPPLNSLKQSKNFNSSLVVFQMQRPVTVWTTNEHFSRQTQMNTLGYPRDMTKKTSHHSPSAME